MKTKNPTRLFLKFFLSVLSLSLLNPCGSFAQEDVPEGQALTSVVSFTDPQIGLLEFTASGRTITGRDATFGGGIIPEAVKFTKKTENKIAGLVRKAGSSNQFYVIDEFGQVSLYTITSFNPVTIFNTYLGKVSIVNFSGTQYVKIAGDKLYVLEAVSSFVVSSDDNGATWAIDTAGLPNFTGVTDFSLDTSQNIYAATSNGLYFQLSNSSTWNKVNAFPTTSPKYVFVDRKNKIWVAKNNSVYFSTNAGSSWSNTTLSYYLAKFCDDVYGNIYGIDNSGLKMLRTSDGGATWTRIDQGITSLALDTTSGFSHPAILNDIIGDSILSAATAFGAFFSTDQGSTWTLDNMGVSAEDIQGYQQLSSGRKVITTSLGVFIKNPGDTSWTQTYPVGKYFAAGKLWKDAADNLFIRGSHPVGSVYSVFKSADGGITWLEDTLGMHIISNGESAFYIDQQGGQHLANGSSVLYSKPLGASWVFDSVGMHAAQFVAVSSFTDGSGKLYVCGRKIGFKGVIMQRPLSSTMWSIDTVGLSNKVMNVLSHDENGNPIASGNPPTFGALPLISYRYNNQWNNVALPSSAIDYNIGAITVDATNGLIVYFKTHDYNFSVDEGHGIYCTHDTGATWNLVGLDSTVMYQLESFGDTSFALTQIGLYKMTCNGVILISGVDHVTNFAEGNLANYPNPFSSSTMISYSLQENSQVKLEVFDLWGRKISELVNQFQSAGLHQLEFDSENLSSGIYLCKLTTNKFSVTEKMMIER